MPFSTLSREIKSFVGIVILLRQIWYRHPMSHFFFTLKSTIYDPFLYIVREPANIIPTVFGYDQTFILIFRQSVFNADPSTDCRCVVDVFQHLLFHLRFPHSPIYGFMIQSVTRPGIYVMRPRQ